MNKEICFWDLISEHNIEIPIIQRDYAQGRIEDQITAIRKNFISTLLQAIRAKTKPLHLGFVYGKLEGKDKLAEKIRNKEAIKNMLYAVEGYAKNLDLEINTTVINEGLSLSQNNHLPTFIPLDGQQRLTTLYLLHWYLVQAETENLYEENCKVLKRFSYKTRKSSLAFCQALCQPENKLSRDAFNGKSISAEIQNSTWFLQVWLRDSTVKGMLVTLDEIHEQLKEYFEKSLLLENLLHKKVISFDFLDLDQLNQTDELYVKMNARGMQLSEFEHFKAWLQKYVADEGLSPKILEMEWKINTDKSWLDLFWHSNKGSYDIDSLIFNAFKQIPLLEYMSTTENIEEDFVKTIRERKYLPFKTFEKIAFYNANSLNFLFNALNSLNDKKKINQYHIWLEEIGTSSFLRNRYLKDFFIKEKSSPGLPETIFYYAFMLFINESTEIQEEEREESFKNWMRITRNLIFNTYIQNPKNFIDAARAIKSLSAYKFNIFEAIKDKDISVEFFNRDQFEEEIIKINLIQTSADWKKCIHSVENHEYFQANINFILKFSQDGNENEYCLDNFKFYSSRAAFLFSNEMRRHPKKLLERSLLGIGDYLPKLGSNHTFCLPASNSLRDRRDNWQRFFKSEKIHILKDLIDQKLQKEGNMENELQFFVDNYDAEDWRKYFVTCPSTITYCRQGFIRFNNEYDIRLLEKTRGYGKHAELRTYNFYIKKFNKTGISPFKKELYFYNPKNQYNYSCIRLNDWEYKEIKYKLEISFHHKKYFLEFNKNGGAIKYQEIIEIFKASGWIGEGGISFYQSYSDQNVLTTALEYILDQLSKLDRTELLEASRSPQKVTSCF